ncbi:dirigent protein 1-like [Primulina tabacum]|uniref:dirigent protein 1-like n=1 Tax=Primulina tabacum TaxID=48773 RepID=UPI003F5ACB04
MGNLGALALIFCSLLIALPSTATLKVTDKEEEVWFQRLCKGKEKVAKLHFYIQDALSNPNATVYEVARSTLTSTSSTSFGQVMVIDDKITEGPHHNSNELGRIQGIITSSDLRVLAFTLNLNIVFTAGKYNSSTLHIVGRNQILDTKRELAIVGGTGVFAMARGRYIQNTYSFDPIANYGVLECIIHVAYL